MARSKTIARGPDPIPRPMRPTSAVTALCAITVACGACGETAATLETGVRVDTLPSGLVRVTNHRAGQWTDDTHWRLEEDLRLGCVDDCGPELFASVAYMTTDAEGRLYVLEYQSQEIRVFSPEGEHLYTMGGLGDGPGELRSAAGLDWGPDGSLWLWGVQHYVVLTPTGEEVARYQRSGRVSGVVYPWMGGFTPDGRYVDWGVDRETSGIVDIGGGIGLLATTGLTWVNPMAFTPPDRFDSLPPLEFTAQVTDDGLPMRNARSFVGIQDGRGDFWWAVTDDYTVYKRTLASDTVLAFSLPADPMPVPSSEVDSLVAEAARREGPGPRLQPEHFVRERWMVMNVLTDEAGHVFVFPQEDALPAGEAVDVFTDEGLYLGRLAFGERVLTEDPPPHVTGRHIYAVVEDELGIPFVVRYRIVKPEG